MKPKRGNILINRIIFFSLAIVPIFFLAMVISFPSSMVVAILPPPETSDGTLSVSSSPSNANVYVNNVYQDITPFSLDLLPNTYNVKLTFPGYYDWVNNTVIVKPNQITSISAILSLIPPNCTSCNCVQVCVDYNVTCRSYISDGKCPEDFGIWSAGGCTSGCQDEDKDCCRAPAQWNAAGWPGVNSRNPYGLGSTTNFCCGNEKTSALNETIMACRYNASQYTDPCNTPCSVGCAQSVSQGCCNFPIDCFDPFTPRCYRNGTNAIVNNIRTYCNNGNWSKQPNIIDGNPAPCINGTIECLSGLCIDQDYDGDISAGDLGICGSCDGNNNAVCGAIAIGRFGNQNGWFVCRGDSSAYRCDDQNITSVDTTVPCYNNSRRGNKLDTSGGGLVTSRADENRNYIRCNGSKVCSGIINMPWTTRGVDPTTIGGGSCVQVDASAPAITTADLSDATPDRVAISHTLKITTTATYLLYAGSPNWKLLLGCWINPGIGGKTGCDQSDIVVGGNPDNNAYMWSVEGLSPPGQSQHADFLFEPRCNSSYVGTRNIDYARIYSGWFANNLWQTSAIGPAAKTFNVVSCETDTDAQAVANFNNSGQCTSGGACSKSYCTASSAMVACPSDLDNTTGCKSSDMISCCTHYPPLQGSSEDWLVEGESTAPFGGYGDGKGNTNMLNPDTGNINDLIAECCGDDVGEYYSNNFAADNPSNTPLCCANPNQCIANGKCNDLASNNGRETSCYDNVDNDCDSYTDFCDGVQVQCPINGLFPGDRRDSDCLGTITGRISDSSTGNPIQGATVQATAHGQTYSPSEGKYKQVTYRVITDSNGVYTINTNGNQTYDLGATGVGYAPTTKLNIIVNFGDSKTVNMALQAAVSECDPDCTTTGSPLCSAACAGQNGCTYYDQIALEACSDKRGGGREAKQPGFRASYDLNYDIICCTGNPVLKEGVRKLDKKIVTQRKNVVRVTKPLIMDGQQVNMVIDVFS